MSRYLRTTLKQGNEYVTARIDKTTGEVRPYAYRVPERKKLPKNKDIDYSVPVFWENKNYKWENEGKASVVRKSYKSVSNPWYGLLDGISMYEARGFADRLVSSEDGFGNGDSMIVTLMSVMPSLDNYFTGAAHIVDGNPLSKNAILQMLKTLSEINSKSIQEMTGYSERQSQKYAAAIRILLNATKEITE